MHNSENKQKEKSRFNSVIEGATDVLAECCYKIAFLNMRPKTNVLFDGLYKYVLYGKTKDFKGIQKEIKIRCLETKIDSLVVCQGIVLKDPGVFERILERPRTVCMDDGRIFIEEEMLNDKNYKKIIPGIINIAGGIFKDKRFYDVYSKRVSEVSPKPSLSL